MDFMNLKGKTFTYAELHRLGYKVFFIQKKKKLGGGYIILLSKEGEQIATIEYLSLYGIKEKNCFLCQDIAIHKSYTSKLYDIILYNARDFFSKLKTFNAFDKNKGMLNMKVTQVNLVAYQGTTKGRKEIYFENGLIALFESSIKKDGNLKNSGNWELLDVRNIYNNI